MPLGGGGRVAIASALVFFPVDSRVRPVVVSVKKSNAPVVITDAYWAAVFSDRQYWVRDWGGNSYQDLT